MKKILLILCLYTISIVANTHHITIRPDTHAPIGVMNEHTHKQNEIMISYRFMPMYMKDLYNGEKKAKDATIGSMMVPQTMQMDMHMIGAMWGISNKITLLGMLNYSNNIMSMQMKKINQEDMTTNGLNDIKVGAIYNIEKTKTNTFIAHTKLSIPIGSIDEKNKTGIQQPYGMQLGSGTYDIDLGSTYTKQFNTTSIGIQGNGTFRLGKNRNNYALGNQYKVSVWGQKNWTSTFSSNIRTTTTIQNNIRGEHKELAEMQDNILNTTKQGYTLSTIGIGANYINNTHLFQGSRFAIEYSIPIFRKTNATNFTPESTLTFGIQHVL
jgi:hypothetical protein